MEGKLQKNQQNKLLKKFFKKQESPEKLNVKETMQHRQYIQMDRKANTRNSIIQLKAPLQKYFGLNKHFESPFNTGHTKIKMPSKTEKNKYLCDHCKIFLKRKQ